MTPRTQTLLLIAALAQAGILAGCDQTDRNRIGSEVAQDSKQAGQAIDDSVITAKVKAALLAEKDLDSTSIHVDTSLGKVILSGKVPNQTQAERAVQVVKGINGVVDVDNTLIAGS